MRLPLPKYWFSSERTGQRAEATHAQDGDGIVKRQFFDIVDILGGFQCSLARFRGKLSLREWCPLLLFTGHNHRCRVELAAGVLNRNMSIFTC